MLQECISLKIKYYNAISAYVTMSFRSQILSQYWFYTASFGAGDQTQDFQKFKEMPDQWMFMTTLIVIFLVNFLEIILK